jgi:predicted Zn-dependent peptidase
MNEYFEAVRSNAAIASLIIRSVLRTGDPADWLKDQKRIEMLNADAVQRAFNTYLLGGAFLWVAVGDQTLLDKLDPRSFEAIRF